MGTSDTPQLGPDRRLRLQRPQRAHPAHGHSQPRRVDGSEGYRTGEDNGIGDFYFGQVRPINRTTIIGTTDYYTDESTEQEALHSYDFYTPAASGTGGTTCRRT